MLSTTRRFYFLGGNFENDQPCSGPNVEIKGPFGTGLRKLVGKRGVIDDIACDCAGLVYRIALLVPVMALGRELKTIDMHRIGFRVLKYRYLPGTSPAAARLR